MKKIFLSFICLLLVILAGCGEKKDILIDSDYTKLKFYTCSPDKFICRKNKEPDSILGGVYSLKGLSTDEYVCHKQYSILSPNGQPNLTPYMCNDVEEPILRFEVKEIRIIIDENNYTFEDQRTINKFLSARRNGKAEEVGCIPEINTSFMFDLPCEMSWQCSVNVNENVNQSEITLLWYNEKFNKWYSSNVNDIQIH